MFIQQAEEIILRLADHIGLMDKFTSEFMKGNIQNPTVTIIG